MMVAYLCFDEVANPDFSHDGYGDSFDNGFDHGGVTLSCRVSRSQTKATTSLVCNGNGE